MVYTVRRTLNRARREVLHLARDVLTLSIEKPDQPDHGDSRSDDGRALPGTTPLEPTTKTDNLRETSPVLVGLVGAYAQDTNRVIGRPDHRSAGPTTTPPTTMAEPLSSGGSG